MSDSTSSSTSISADPAVVLDVIADFERYPDWVENMVSTRILTQDDDGWPLSVRFEVDAGVLRDTYVLAYTWDVDQDGIGEISWKLLESTVMRSLDGSYRLERAKSLTAVTYELRAEVKIPIVSMLRRKAEKSIVDQALRGLKQRCEG